VGWQVTRPPCALPRRLRSYPQGARIVSHPLRRPVYRPGSATDCHFACLGSGRVATTPISPGLGKPHHRRELARLGSVQCGLKARKGLDAPERDVAKGGCGGGARSSLTRVRNGGRRYYSRTHLPRGRPAASEVPLPIVAAVGSSTAVRLPSQSPGRVVFRSAIWSVEPPVVFSALVIVHDLLKCIFHKRPVAAMAHFRTIVFCPRRL
jgi:hypothetical protein